jgi:PPOX class probable F420-dependent enzyme
MPSRRDQIELSEEELRSFLAESMVMQCATAGPRGWPHMVPLWYVPDGLELRAWTYWKSQKARNLERDPRATVGVESGVEYHELKGAMLECDVELIRDVEALGEFADRLVERYAGGSDEAKEAFRAQAPKRIGLRFKPRHIATWDHSKLGGTY